MPEVASGMIAQPITFRNHEGKEVCTTIQRFSTLDIIIASAQLALWSVPPTDIHADIAGSNILLKNSSGQVLLQALLWYSVELRNVIKDQETFCLHLVKEPRHVGSWPYAFQILSIALPPTSNSLTTVWNRDSAEFEKNMRALIAERRLELLALKTSFVQDVHNQMGPALLKGDTSRVTFCFPTEASPCADYLRTHRVLPTIQKLLHISKKILRVDILLGSKPEEEHLVKLATCTLAGLAALEVLRAQAGLPAIQAASACLGCGSGEFSALVFAGCLKLEDALRLIGVQARATAQAGFEVSSLPITAVQTELEGMSLQNPRIAVFSGSTGQRYASLATIREWLPRAVCDFKPAARRGLELKVALLQQGHGRFLELIPVDSYIDV